MTLHLSQLRLLLLLGRRLQHGPHSLALHLLVGVLRLPLLHGLLLQEARLLLLRRKQLLLGPLRLHVGGAQGGVGASAGTRRGLQRARGGGHGGGEGGDGGGGGGGQGRHRVGGQRLHARPLRCLLSQQKLPLLLHSMPHRLVAHRASYNLTRDFSVVPRDKHGDCKHIKH